jgi:hypothetical protein
MPFNLEKADWKLFSETILKLENTEFKWTDYNSDLYKNKEQWLEHETIKLTNQIKKAAEFSIPRTKAYSKSKAWWNENITKFKRQMNQAKRKWRKGSTNSEDSILYDNYIAQRNKYFQEIKTAKTKC